jgi:alkylation response protein AidB-like acyl-CoA dehydrogenase
MTSNTPDRLRKIDGIAPQQKPVATVNAPSTATVNQVMTGKQLVTRHAIAAVERAMELAGGAGFYRAADLERRFRDIQAARYHPQNQDHKPN